MLGPGRAAVGAEAACSRDVASSGHDVDHPVQISGRRLGPARSERVASPGFVNRAMREDLKGVS
jgi:hypothetical protein